MKKVIIFLTAAASTCFLLSALLIIGAGCGQLIIPVDQNEECLTLLSLDKADGDVRPGARASANYSAEITCSGFMDRAEAFADSDEDIVVRYKLALEGIDKINYLSVSSGSFLFVDPEPKLNQVAELDYTGSDIKFDARVSVKIDIPRYTRFDRIEVSPPKEIEFVMDVFKKTENKISSEDETI